MYVCTKGNFFSFFLCLSLRLKTFHIYFYHTFVVFHVLIFLNRYSCLFFPGVILANVRLFIHRCSDKSSLNGYQWPASTGLFKICISYLFDLRRVDPFLTFWLNVIELYVDLQWTPFQNLGCIDEVHCKHFERPCIYRNSNV